MACLLSAQYLLSYPQALTLLPMTAQAALNHAHVLDDKCTAKEVVTMFMRINADDEIYLPERGVTKVRHLPRAAYQPTLSQHRWIATHSLITGCVRHPARGVQRSSTLTNSATLFAESATRRSLRRRARTCPSRRRSTIGSASTSSQH